MSTPKTADEIERRMRRVRCDLGDQVDELVDSAKHIGAQFTDWRSYVSANPWPWMAIAAGVGYMVVPTRVSVDRPVAETLTDLARTGAIKLETPAPKQTLMTQAINMGIGIASSLVLRAAINMLSPALDRMASSAASALQGSPEGGAHPVEDPFRHK